MSLASKDLRRPGRDDALRWYAIPTRQALLLLFDGSLPLDKLAADTVAQHPSIGRVPLIRESEARREQSGWSTFAYRVASEGSKPIYETIAGDGDEDAEATTLVLTAESVDLIVTFRYRTVLTDHGQVLVAFEFSRRGISRPTTRSTRRC